MDIIVFGLVGALIFICGFIFGDLCGFVRKQEQRMIKIMQEIIDTQNEIIRQYKDEIHN